MTLNRLALERESITFTWKKNSDLPSFRLAIARDREFANTVYTADSAANFAQVNKALENGAYFWRITGMAEGRPATEPSQAREFRVVESDTMALVRPADGSVLSPAPGDRDVRANFAWQRADMSGRYRLQVSRDGAFSSLDRDITTDDTGHTVSLKDPGEYFWRVLFQDEKGEELMKSAPYRLLVREALGLPLAITPAGGSVVDMSNQSSLSFRWREVKGATLYRISVFQRSGGVNTNIFEKETAGTELALSELEKLDVGNFYWTVQAFEVQGRGNIVRRSAEVKSEFSITLRQFADKPKIKVPKKIYIE
jgi:hypothetical protein